MSAFWERRKAAVAAEEEAARLEREAALAAEQEAALAEQCDEELLAEKGLKEPEALDSPEEIRAFLNEALPQRLKTRALRRMWRLNPTLANLDGLVDYGEDFTDAATVVENLQTAYQVGKGMLKSIEAYAAEAEAKERAQEEALAGVSQGEAGEASADVAQAPTLTDGEDLARDEDDAPAPEAAHDPEPYAWAETDETDTMPAPSSRRMRFAFDGAQT
ncbi:DUF3306 domain-containing protein [Cognatishimia sp. F0-27]|uniref:DUF3306 domain-containing protein n=1 Tax=Cognatishimia sp. F0-27 TaxID=2816855 RepID=UPI001D0C7711|nr:DUF3306 domain-containing protein [Cognatishimia sp. F0-27]MCC1492933.1 DUF3306 domain-containing protein [Cognatishimia sp. F0-27]